MGYRKYVGLVTFVTLAFVHYSQAVLLKVCADTAACHTGGDANSVCAKKGETGGDDDGNCICNGTYKADGTGDACIAKALLQTCANNAACQNTQSGGDAHAVCAKAGETGGDADGNCICNGTYKANGDTCVVKAVSELDCNPADTDSKTGGTAACKAVDAHANCPAGTRKCACNNGYKQDTTKVNTCVKVLGGMCSGSSSCTGTDNSKCSATTSKCVCVTNYIEDASICKKALGQKCTKAEECVTHADCATTCTCSSGYINTGGLCGLPSTASSVWMTTSVVLSSPLIYVLRLIH